MRGSHCQRAGIVRRQRICCPRAHAVASPPLSFDGTPPPAPLSTVHRDTYSTVAVKQSTHIWGAGGLRAPSGDRNHRHPNDWAAAVFLQTQAPTQRFQVLLLRVLPPPPVRLVFRHHSFECRAEEPRGGATTSRGGRSGRSEGRRGWRQDAGTGHRLQPHGQRATEPRSCDEQLRS